jgi:hypothetical protein
MNVTLSTLASQQTRGTKLTKADAKKFLNYCATHPDATICYYPFDMILKVHSDTSYNSEPKAHSRAGGHFYMGNRDTNKCNHYTYTPLHQNKTSTLPSCRQGESSSK